ncbi:nucleoside monophosphate kinase [Candidatus Berkelbacteria bacterium]|nr:nucleoside monophosphate kinase [Candidatus Berkelbacteria bacterium]
MTYRLTTTPTLLHVLGPQGSGKGTQVALLNAVLNVALPVITMGQVFRDEIAKSTVRGQQIKAIIDPGGKVPAALWEPILRDYLATLDLSNGALLDGVVRDINQLNAFERLRSEQGLPEPYVLAIQVPEEESIKRLLLRGRHDDTEAAIHRRLAWSQAEVEPVIDLYITHGRTIYVNGLGSVDTIHDRIISKLVIAGLLTPLT